MSEKASVSERGLGASLLNSIKGVGIGTLLFFSSFWILWMNEGRIDLSDIAQKSLPVSADSIDKAAEGKFISVTGELMAGGKLEDPEFLQPGDYISLTREPEMYAWVETEHKADKKKSEEKPQYTHEVRWTGSPQLPKDMNDAKGHENPPLPFPRQSFTAPKALVGVYSFKATEAELPTSEPLQLTNEMLRPAKPEAASDKAEGDKAEGDKAEGDKAEGDKAEGDKAEGDKAKGGDSEKGEGDKAKADEDKKDDDGDDEKSKKKKKKSKKRHGRKKGRHKPPAPEKSADAAKAEAKPAVAVINKPAGFSRVNEMYLFRGSGTLDSPKAGDVRIGWKVLKPSGPVTLFGVLKDGEVQAYAQEGMKLFRVIKGSRQDAIKSLAAEHSTSAWAIRLIGFLMMWSGLMLFFGPLNALLDIIPFLGTAGRLITAAVLLPVALTLSIFTITLSIVFHNIILLLLLLGGLGATVFFLYQKKKITRGSPAEASSPAEAPAPAAAPAPAEAPPKESAGS